MELKKVRSAAVTTVAIATLSLASFAAGCGNRDTSATTPANEEIGKQAAQAAQEAAQKNHPQQMSPGAQAAAAARAAAMGRH